MAKNVTLTYTDDVINAAGKISSTGKSVLKSFENVRFTAEMEDGTIHRFRLQASLYDEGEYTEREKKASGLGKAAVTVD